MLIWKVLFSTWSSYRIIHIGGLLEAYPNSKLQMVSRSFLRYRCASLEQIVEHSWSSSLCGKVRGRVASHRSALQNHKCQRSAQPDRYSSSKRPRAFPLFRYILRNAQASDEAYGFSLIDAQCLGNGRTSARACIDNREMWKWSSRYPCRVVEALRSNHQCATWASSSR